MENSPIKAACTLDYNNKSAGKDYYPFGMLMPERSYASPAYRYGFNGQENDQESGTQDYGMRIYNSSLARFLSVDPLINKFPMLTPYQYASNTPIWAIDLDGLEAVVYTVGSSGQAGSEAGHGHTLISVYTAEEGLIVYSYGRYGQNQDPVNGDGYLIKYTGAEAEKVLRKEVFNSGADAKAYFIESADSKKIQTYYDKLLDSGTEMPDNDPNKKDYYKTTTSDGKTTYEEAKDKKIRRINIYSILAGNNCVGSVQDGLKKGGFDYNNQLDEPDEYKGNEKICVGVEIPIIGFKIVCKAFDWSVQVFNRRLDTTAKNDSKKETKRVVDVTDKGKKDTGSFLKGKYGKKK